MPVRAGGAYVPVALEQERVGSTRTSLSSMTRFLGIEGLPISGAVFSLSLSLLSTCVIDGHLTVCDSHVSYRTAYTLFYSNPFSFLYDVHLKYLN